MATIRVWREPMSPIRRPADRLRRAHSRAVVSSSRDPSTIAFSISAATCRKMGPASSFTSRAG